VGLVDPTTRLIRFKTDKPGTGLVRYGPTDNHGVSTDIGPGYSKEHTAILRNLPEGQADAQYLQIVMKDMAGNLTTTKDTTLAGGTPLSDNGQVPVISEVAAANVTTTSAEITWTTNEPATAQVDYGLTSSYGSTHQVWDWLDTSHTMTLTKLTPNTTYHYRVCGSDPFGNAACSTDFTFTTPANEAVLCGDADQNNAVTLADVIKLIRYILASDTPPSPGTRAFKAGDVNCDGALTLSDALLLVKYLLGQAQLACCGGG